MQTITLSKSLHDPDVSDRLRPLGIRIVEKENLADIYPPDEHIDLLWLSDEMVIRQFDSVLRPGAYVAVCYRGFKYDKPDNYKMVTSFVGTHNQYVLLQKVYKMA